MALVGAQMTQYFDRVKNMVTPQDPNAPKGLMQQMDEAVTLTWKQRAIGFACCAGIGLLFSIISIPMLWTMKVVAFAIMYSIGSILAIGSTMFLMGPTAQIKRMMENNRIYATATYLIMIIATLFVAFKFGNAGICLIFVILQFAALIWYASTWVPGGQAAIKAMIFGTG